MIGTNGTLPRPPASCSRAMNRLSRSTNLGCRNIPGPFEPTPVGSKPGISGLATNVGAVVQGTYGSVTIASNGTWTYTLDNGDGDTQALAHAAAPSPRPRTEARNRNLKARDWDRNYVHSLDWLWLTEPLSEGPGESWINQTVDLVKGETMTPLERLFAVADCANGIGSKLDITKWTFLNTDLAVHVFRIPDGDWIGIRAETSYGPDGVGTTVGTLFDERGAVGAIQQCVLVRGRPGKSGRGAKRP